MTMRYLKALAIGVGTGIVAAAVWIVLTVVVPVAIQFGRQANRGAGLVAFSAGLAEPTFIFLVGFILGFYWSLRRSRRTAALR